MMKNFALQKNFKIATFLMFTVMTLLISTTSAAQEFKVLELKNISAERSASTVSDLKEINSLVSQLYPTVYFLKGKISTYGETSPLRLETDIQGISNLSEISQKTESIKIAKIVLNNQSDLNGKIDTAAFSSFSSLRYLYVVANFGAKESQIANMIINTNPDILVLFSGSGK